jgi:hypothetical protein
LPTAEKQLAIYELILIKGLSVRDVERPGERLSGRLEPNEKLDASERRVEGMALLGRLLESRPRLDGT